MASFAQANLGDVSPNTAGPKCIDTGEPNFISSVNQSHSLSTLQENLAIMSNLRVTSRHESNIASLSVQAKTETCSSPLILLGLDNSTPLKEYCQSENIVWLVWLVEVSAMLLLHLLHWPGFEPSSSIWIFHIPPFEIAS